ncbi:MAG: ribonuclease H-like domain-containing protein [Chloroflexi bacterium]|nr:ribonuclease H-like domain-containing protein [Chloroflexota bacterium]
MTDLDWAPGEESGLLSRDSLFLDSYRYGSVALSDFIQRTVHLSHLTAQRVRLDANQFVFLDLETTGLSGSANSYPFLVGMARVQSGGLLVRQVFLTSPTREPALLRSIQSFCAGAQALVTFNGRAFDVPLLRSRATFIRSQLALPEEHIDLLNPARRLWRARLRSCALTNLERQVLDEWRAGDVPSALIPEFYYRFLHSGDAMPLQPVFEHNRRDVLAMVALAGVIARIHAEPAPPRMHPQDALSVGNLLVQAGQYDAAATSFRRALLGYLPALARSEAFWGLGRCLLQLGRNDDAREVFLLAAQIGGPCGLQAAIWLAKFYEHRLVAYDEAIQMTERALALSSTERARESLGHRLRRLRGKRYRVSSRTSRETGETRPSSTVSEE